MIIDIRRFVELERPHWQQLEAALDRLARDPAARMDLEQAKHFHYLYERVSADLARIATFASERETRRYLEALVARAYAEIHETREKPHRFAPLTWFAVTLPCTFRRHVRAFRLAVAVTLVGSLFGAVALAIDPEARETIMPWPQLLSDPAERVKREESSPEHTLDGQRTAMAAWYMTHNTEVSVTLLAMGMTYGIGTLVLLFYNGVLLGAVCADYVLAGKGVFVAGWLLPHGSVEIPAVLLAGQASFVLAGALVGWRSRLGLRARLRLVMPDIVTLIGGVAVLLVWAGIVESGLSQYHEPIIPYAMKIAIGVVELALLTLFLARSGRRHDAAQAAHYMARRQEETLSVSGRPGGSA